MNLKLCFSIQVNITCVLWCQLEWMDTEKKSKNFKGQYNGCQLPLYDIRRKQLSQSKVNGSDLGWDFLFIFFKLAAFLKVKNEMSNSETLSLITLIWTMFTNKNLQPGRTTAYQHCHLSSSLWVNLSSLSLSWQRQPSPLIVCPSW